MEMFNKIPIICFGTFMIAVELLNIKNNINMESV